MLARYLRVVHARVDRVDVALGVVLVLSACLYVWTAGTSVPLSLHSGLSDRYNLLASALLHFHLSVGPAPAGLLHVSNPYDPAQNGPFLVSVNDATSIYDDVLYDGRLYFEWGPAPAIVLLAPLHLLGFEPSASVTVSVFGVVGLGFALASLRALLRQLGELPLWMCILAGFALALCSAMPFLLRTPSVSEDTLAGGYCFIMAGIWLAAAALVSRKASWRRLVLMSLCFGLAAGSRPTLGLVAVVLVPVYLGLRSSRSRRRLALMLALPFGVCVLLLLAYNQARFNNPLEVGTHYQLSSYDARTAPLGHVDYLLPGVRFYGVTPPRLSVLFPFILLQAPQSSLRDVVAPPEPTGGILPMAPVVIFLAALPWLRWRRPALLGGMATALLALVGAGVCIVLLTSYEFFSSTERYEVDFATLLVLGGVASWLALSQGAPSHRRRLVRVGGGLLVAWGCATGFAVSFIGYGNLLAVGYPGTWRTLEDLGSPISTAIVALAGHPVLAAVQARNNFEAAAQSETSVGRGVTKFALSPIEAAGLTIVSPDARTATLAATITVLPSRRYALEVAGPGSAVHTYALTDGGGPIAIPVRLSSGLNRFALSPIVAPTNGLSETTPVILFSDLIVSG